MSRFPLIRSNSLRSFAAALLFTFAWAALSAAPVEAAEHRLGVGAHFWETVDDLVDSGFGEIEDDGFTYLVTYKYLPRGLFGVGVDVEFYEDYGVANRESVAPIAWLYVGKKLYGAVGVGTHLFSSSAIDGDSEEFWAARAGFEFYLLPRVTLDVNANYRDTSFDELGQADTDTITLGAAIRWTF